MEETFRDPQVKARNMLIDIEDSRYGNVRQAGIAIKLSDTPGEVRSVAPSVGEHTHEVLEALGYEQSERSRLYDTGAVA